MFGYQPPTSAGADSIKTFSAFIVAIIFTGILPAVCEEIAHRGLLLNGLKRLGLTRAIIFSTVLFGLIHLNIMQAFYAMVMGALMAIAVVASGSIIPAMIIHFMNNSINVYLEYVRGTNYFGCNFSSSINNFTNVYGFITAFLFMMVLLTAIIVSIGYLLILLNVLQKRKCASVKTVSNIASVESEEGQTLINGEAVNLEGVAVSSVLMEEEVSPPLPNFGRRQTLFEKIIVKTEADMYLPSLREKFFLYSAIALGTIITIFTFVWGTM